MNAACEVAETLHAARLRPAKCLRAAGRPAFADDRRAVGRGCIGLAEKVTPGNIAEPLEAARLCPAERLEPIVGVAPADDDRAVSRNCITERGDQNIDASAGQIAKTKEKRRRLQRCGQPSRDRNGNQPGCMVFEVPHSSRSACYWLDPGAARPRGS